MRRNMIRKNTMQKSLYGLLLGSLLLLTACGNQGDKLSDSQADSQQNSQSENGSAETLADMETNEETPQKDAVSDESDKSALSEDAAENETDKAQEDTCDLSGMQLSILGDSISTFDEWIPEGYAVFYPRNGEVKKVEQTWWMMLLEDTGMELCVNGSSSGSTCIGDSSSLENPKYGCSDYRTAALIGKAGAYPDIIIVYMGTNDFLNGVPIGENDGTKYIEEGDVKNFSDAYCLMLDKLEAQYPIAQIFCCNLLEVGIWGTGDKPFDMLENELGLTSEEYSKQIETIAGTRGYPVIDLAHCGITIDNMPQYITDGVHPNVDGMKVIRDAVEAGIRKFYDFAS